LDGTAKLTPPGPLTTPPAAPINPGAAPGSDADTSMRTRPSTRSPKRKARLGTSANVAPSAPGLGSGAPGLAAR
jgi:hypothetical protein